MEIGAAVEGSNPVDVVIFDNPSLRRFGGLKRIVGFYSAERILAL